MNILEIAGASDDFEVLTQSLLLTGLANTVATTNDITVFAPTDAAFGQLAVDLGFTGDVTDTTEVFSFIAAALAQIAPDGDPAPLLTDILLYHVSGTALSSQEVTAASTIPTLLTGSEISPSGPVLGDLEPDVLDPTLITPDIPADNGVIHAIDRVLLPFDVVAGDAPSITEIVAASGDLDDNPADFDLLLASLQVTGLDIVLDSAGLDATVFAPTDAAFVALAQDLGFGGSDEIGALGAILASLTDLGDGDPLPLLTSILTYHVSPGAKQATEVAALGQIETLQGSTFDISGTTLVDNEPDLADPALGTTDLQASNGIVHVIDRVLLPFDIPASNGANDVKILIGTDGRDRLQGGADNDLLIDGVSADVLIGGGGADVFDLAGDGSRDKIIDFEDGADRLDVSRWGAESLDDLTVAQRNTSSLLVSAGSNSVVLQAANQSITVADLTADSFIFGEPTGGQTITGTDGRDVLEGTLRDDLIDGGLGRDFLEGGDGADIFVAGADTADVILDFTENLDQIDVSGWGVTGFGDLLFTQLKPGTVSIDSGSNSVFVKAADQVITGSDFDADDFIFAVGTGGETITGTDARDRLTGTGGDDLIDGGLGRDFLEGGNGADIFVAGADTADVILDFTENLDQIDVSGWGISGFEDLTFNQLKAGVVSVESGDNSVFVKAADQVITGADFDADDFVF